MRPIDLVSLRLARGVAGVSLAALVLSTLSGCQKTVAQAAPPPPDGRRGRVEADGRAGDGDPRTGRPAPWRT